MFTACLQHVYSMFTAHVYSIFTPLKRAARVCVSRKHAVFCKHPVHMQTFLGVWAHRGRRSAHPAPSQAPQTQISGPPGAKQAPRPVRSRGAPPLVCSTGSHPAARRAAGEADQASPPPVSGAASERAGVGRGAAGEGPAGGALRHLDEHHTQLPGHTPHPLPTARGAPW